MFFVLLIVLTFLKSFAQKIDNTNYYSFHEKGHGITTNWLRVSEVVPIIIDELNKNGIEYHKINVGELHSLNDSTLLVITVAFDKGDKQAGFVYEQRHSALINVKEREFLKDTNQQRYSQIQRGTQYKWMTTDKLPQNIFLLKQTVYWYQYRGGKTNFPVNKSRIEDILRQDIRDYLKRL